MAVTQAQKVLVAKTRSVGTAKEAEALSDADCVFLIGVIARELGLLSDFPELAQSFPEFFDVDPTVARPIIGNVEFWPLFERLLQKDANADTFFSCLGTLYKARIKYANILVQQPIPTMDQVGPRGLLQYGSLSASALTSFLLWRKWLFDIDNRSGQETGYLFEPIIAYAIGGTPASSTSSPVRRRDVAGGRQVDCIRDKRAYEFKVRVTIAASGQGRWGEELAFPADCQASGFVPVLIVLDPTPNPKLAELSRAFQAVGGEVYVGSDAWRHLDNEAGPTMARFLEQYVRKPIEDLLAHVPGLLPPMTIGMAADAITISVADDVLRIKRTSIHTSDESV